MFWCEKMNIYIKYNINMNSDDILSFCYACGIIALFLVILIYCVSRITKEYDEEHAREKEKHFKKWNYMEKLSDDEKLEILKRNGLHLQYMLTQTEEMCIEAVKQNVNAYQYIRIPITDKILETYFGHKKDE